MKRRSRLALIGSFATHLILICALWFPQPASHLYVADKPIEVDVYEPKVTEVGKPATQPAQKKIIVKNLYEVGLSTSEKESRTDVGGRGDQDRNPTLKDSLEAESSLSLLWRRLDGRLEYSKDLADERIVGDVRIEFQVNSDGTIASDDIKSKSTSAILETYALISVIEALKTPLTRKLWDGEQTRKVNVHITYEVKISGTVDKSRKPQGLWGNRLVFVRHQFVDAKVFKAIEKFFTRIVPPILIFPGGLYVDFIRLYQYVQNIGTPDPDDMRRFRIEQLREQLEQSKK
jgi:hypothetical protein